jgi:LPXTG-motif cell wall-anchored protein
VPTDVVLDLDDPQVPGYPPRSASLDVSFGEDPTGTLLMQLDVDAPNATIYFGNGPGCDSPDLVPYIECAIDDPGTANTFTFTIAAATGTELGEYDYTLTILLDGTEIHSEAGEIEVVEERYEGVYRDYVHEYLSFTDVEPGTVVEAEPRIMQGPALPDDIVALAAYFGGSVAPGGTIDGAVARVPWDNCQSDFVGPGGGYFCVFTDVEDLPGTVFEFSEPLQYAVAEDAPGPLRVCGCSFDLWAMNQEVLDRDFGGPWWDPGSSNLLSVVTAADQSAPEPADDPSRGLVDIVTAEGTYDLEVEGADLAGGEDQMTIPVENLGPASALNRALSETEPGYQLRGQLPEGAEFVSVDNEGDGHWYCESGDLSDLYEAAGDDTELDRFDFVCHFWRLPSGEKHEFEFTVDVTDATGEAGRVEVAALWRGVDGVNLDGDLSNNTAALTVDDRSLPNTGQSTILFVAVAAGAVVLGVVLFLLTRRRKDASEPADPS